MIRWFFNLTFPRNKLAESNIVALEASPSPAPPIRASYAFVRSRES